MPDREDSAAVIACRSLEPLFEGLYEALARAGADAAAPEVLRVAAEAYALGHRDGARHAVADIAPAAAAHGLRLWLGPELCDGGEDGRMPPSPEGLG